MQELQSETRAIETLEQHLLVHVEFGGINTDEATNGLRRATKGGVLEGRHLTALGRLSDGVERLQAALEGAKAAVAGSVHAPAIKLLTARCERALGLLWPLLSSTPERARLCATR